MGAKKSGSCQLLGSLAVRFMVVTLGWLGVVAPAFNPSAQEAGLSELRVPGQPGVQGISGPFELHRPCGKQQKLSRLSTRLVDLSSGYGAALAEE